MTDFMGTYGYLVAPAYIRVQVYEPAALDNRIHAFQIRKILIVYHMDTELLRDLERVPRPVFAYKALGFFVYVIICHEITPLEGNLKKDVFVIQPGF
jgi:hypothetical protein